MVDIETPKKATADPKQDTKAKNIMVNQAGTFRIKSPFNTVSSKVKWTPACGTGACAAVVAAVLNGYCPVNEDITVKVRGGELTVRYTSEGMILTGAVTQVYQGTIEV